MFTYATSKRIWYVICLRLLRISSPETSPTQLLYLINIYIYNAWVQVKIGYPNNLFVNTKHLLKSVSPSGASFLTYPHLNIDSNIYIHIYIYWYSYMIFKSVDVSKYFYTIDVFVFLYMLFKIVLQKNRYMYTRIITKPEFVHFYWALSAQDIMGHPPRARVNGKNFQWTAPSPCCFYSYISQKCVYIYIIYPCLVLFGIVCLCCLPLYRHCLLIF